MVSLTKLSSWSEGAAQRSSAATQSKDPYSLSDPCRKEDRSAREDDGSGHFVVVDLTRSCSPAHQPRRGKRDRQLPTPLSPFPPKYKRSQTPPRVAGRISPKPRHVLPDSNSSSRSKYYDPSASPASSPHTSLAPNTSLGCR